ncbi:MAG: cytochrome c [Gammaproteobacteria bacterium]|nr:cytochrome c [Gammaproteobacteria bacterium]
MKKFFLIILASVATTQIVAQETGGPITYSGHVARIINENCVVCHREGGIGPMELSSYEHVRPWAPLIQLKVASREMPPYAYDHDIGIQNLRADWRLSQEDIDTVVAWVDQGSPLGNLEELPPMPVLRDIDDWNFADQLGQPDVVIASNPIEVPASGNDMWVKQYIDSDLTEGRCIKALQVKPRGDANTVVHHATTYFARANAEGGFDREPASAYSMGMWGELVPEEVCRPVFGESIYWDIHMYPGGIGATAPNAVVEDNVAELGIWLHPPEYKAKITQDITAYQMDQGDMFIPPHGTTMTQGFHSFDHPVRIDSFAPHGHLRMNAASLEIFYPETGRTELISSISNWSATWHHSHLYEQESAPLVPTGAILIAKQWYDNTADNPNNPDPDQWVGWGERTADEMSHFVVAVSHLDEETYQELAERREANE